VAVLTATTNQETNDNTRMPYYYPCMLINQSINQSIDQ